MARDEIEIARQEGTEFRSVRLGLGDDGAIQMAAQDIGPMVAAVVGDDEYEFWVRIEAPALAKLAFELLREKFTGELRAVNTFREWCKTHGVEHEFASYS